MSTPPRTILTRARMIANTKADQNPSNVNPGTIFATKSTMRTLITRDMSPSVSIFRGNVRSFKIGPMVLLTTARTTATMIAVIYPSTCAPGVRYEAMATANPDIKIFKIIAIYRKLRLRLIIICLFKEKQIERTWTTRSRIVFPLSKGTDTVSCIWFRFFSFLQSNYTNGLCKVKTSHY